MKKLILKTVALIAFVSFTFPNISNAGKCSDTGLVDNGCKLYDCEDSTLKECPDGSKEVIL